MRNARISAHDGTRVRANVITLDPICAIRYDRDKLCIVGRLTSDIPACYRWIAIVPPESLVKEMCARNTRIDRDITGRGYSRKESNSCVRERDATRNTASKLRNFSSRYSEEREIERSYDVENRDENVSREFDSFLPPSDRTNDNFEDVFLVTGISRSLVYTRCNYCLPSCFLCFIHLMNFQTTVAHQVIFLYYRLFHKCGIRRS